MNLFQGIWQKTKWKISSPPPEFVSFVPKTSVLPMSYSDPLLKIIEIYLESSV